MAALTGKVAIVTASSRGIGAAVAQRLSQDGAAVVVNYVASPEKAEAVVKAIETQGGRAIAIQGNVANQADVQRLFDATEQQFGPIDIVVNVAGTAVYKPHAELTDEDFNKVFAVNVRGAMYVLQAAGDRIKDGGRIVQFSSGATQLPKATVNVVSPGVTDTDGLILSPPAIAHLISQTPLGRLGQPGDIADVVAFLVSDDAHWMTGQNLQVNGGIL
jgi:3-oxoacyl-[acyl-carrier protein] reductase